jgi:hypothetical protein
MLWQIEDKNIMFKDIRGRTSNTFPIKDTDQVFFEGQHKFKIEINTLRKLA